MLYNIYLCVFVCVYIYNLCVCVCLCVCRDLLERECKFFLKNVGHLREIFRF